MMDKRLYKRIMEKKKDLDSLRPLNKDQVKRLRRQFSVELAYNSNAIEGNTLTLQETRMAIEEGITVGGKPLKDYLEAVNHEKAFELIEVLASRKAKPTAKSIQEIHSVIMKCISEWAGRYRNKRIRITGARFTPPDPSKIPALMSELEKSMAEKHDNPVEFAAEAHYQLVRIHPFFDGNGRTARLLMNLILMSEGFPPVVLKAVDRKKYYQVLRKADEGDLKPLADFVGRAVEQSLIMYLDALEKPTKKNKLIPLREAAKHSKYSQEYLSLLSRKGRIGAVKIGRKWFITLKELEEYEKSHE